MKNEATTKPAIAKTGLIAQSNKANPAPISSCFVLLIPPLLAYLK